MKGFWYSFNVFKNIDLKLSEADIKRVFPSNRDKIWFREGQLIVFVSQAKISIPVWKGKSSQFTSGQLSAKKKVEEREVFAGGKWQGSFARSTDWRRRIRDREKIERNLLKVLDTRVTAGKHEPVGCRRQKESEEEGRREGSSLALQESA